MAKDVEENAGRFAPKNVNDHVSGDLVATLTLLTLLAVSLALNVGLGWKVKRLLPLARAVEGEPGQIVIGSVLPPITARDSGGAAVKIPFDGPLPTLIYVFVPTCVWCQRNFQNIQALARSLGGRYRVIGISLNRFGLQEHIKLNRLDFPVYSDLGPGISGALRLGRSPQTLVVSARGRLLKDWVGAYRPDLQPRIEAYFNVRLPGLTEVNDLH